MWIQLWGYIVFCLFSLYVKSSGEATKGDQVIRIMPNSQLELNKVLSMITSHLDGVQVWTYPTKFQQYLDIQIPEGELTNFKQTLVQMGLKYKILIPNLKDLIKSQKNQRKKRIAFDFNTLEEFNYEIYHEANEIEQWMTVAQSQFPEKVEKFQIGTTYEGRPINALKISNSLNNSTKPVIYLDALIHSREWVTAASTIFMFKEILTNPANSWMLEAVDWYFIPMLNVDGYIYSWASDDNRLWRKTRSQGASKNCYGVDANRNFNDHWAGTGTSDEPCSSLFGGQFAESEPEVRHISRFITRNKNKIKAVLTVHSYAQLIMYPYNYELGAYPPNNDEQNSTAKAMSEAMYDVHNVTYNYGPAAETLFVLTGVTTDWTQAEAEIDINYTIELRDTGEYGFLLPEDQIIPTGEELLAGVKVLAKHLRDRPSSGGSGEGSGDEP